MTEHNKVKNENAVIAHIFPYLSEDVKKAEREYKRGQSIKLENILPKQNW
ncbi:MAG: hypothetical protein V1896_02180 [Candidatus Zambryskibacteria bacterium]